MSIKLTYKDLSTGSILKEIILEDEDIKVLKTDIASVEEWHANALENKLRRATNALLRRILDHPSTYLTSEDLVEIEKELDTAGIVFPRVSALPDRIKKEIIKRATIPTPPPTS